jgi:hypothetical protein
MALTFNHKFLGVIFIFFFFFHFNASNNNDSVFTALMQPQLARVFDGYNASFVALGAPKTGKRWTFFGSPGVEKGVLELTCENIFDEISQRTSSTFFVTVSSFQLLQRNLTDLLNPGPRDTLSIQDHRICGAYVDGVAELEVNSFEEAYKYIQEAKNVHDLLGRRSTTLGAPHVFFDIRIEGREASSKIIKTGLLRIALLAGTAGVSLEVDEGLKALVTVLDKLSSREPVTAVPFRQSALTRLLQPGLGGNAVCTFLGLVSPERRALKDTVRTLQLLKRAGAVESKVKINYNTVQTSVATLRRDIAAARGEMKLTRPGQALHDIDPVLLADLQLLIKELNFIKTRTWDARKERSRLLEAERLANIRAKGLTRALDVPQEVNHTQQTGKSLREQMTDYVATFVKAQENIESKTAKLQQYLESQERRGANQTIDEKAKSMEREINQAKTQAAGAQSKLVFFSISVQEACG